MSAQGVVGKRSRHQLRAAARASRAWVRRHPDAARQVVKSSRARRRLRALTVVGRGVLRCSNCPCNDPRLLEINHINGGGRAERRANPKDKNLYGRILRGERNLDDLNLLCIVCNALDRARRKAPDAATRYRILFRYAYDPVERHERAKRSWATRVARGRAQRDGGPFASVVGVTTLETATPG